MPHDNHTEFVFIRFFMYVCKNKDIYCKIIGVSDLGRVGFAMHYWLPLSNSSMLDCIRFERAESPMSA